MRIKDIWIGIYIEVVFKREEGMNKTMLKELRDEFRNWYGTLSVEELVTNFELIEFIKRIEAHFALAGV